MDAGEHLCECGEPISARRAQCKRCYARAYWHTTKERRLELQRVYDARRRSTPEWKAQEKERRRAYYQANSEEARAQRRAYYAENRDAQRAARRAYHHANPQVSAAGYQRRRADPQLRARDEAVTQAWIAANQQTRTSIEAVRRARKAGTATERVYRSVVWRRDSGICYVCGEAADPDDWHMDHTIPLSKGGSHTYGNVGVAHPSCNLAKKHADPRDPDSPYAYLLAIDDHGFSASTT